MSDIFISYKREERDKARAIAEMLVMHGYDVWWDTELLPGDRFSKEIDEVIKKASAAIVLWSKKAVDSDFVRAEANRANSKEIMISVRLDECEIPIPYNIHHFLDLSKWDNTPDSALLDPLLGAVEKKIGSRSKKVQSEKEIEEIIQQPKAHVEVEYWKSISEDKSPKIKEYRAYIKKYGEGGLFYDLAKVKIEELDEGKKSSLNSKKNIQALVIVGLFLLIPIAWILYGQFKTIESVCVGSSEDEYKKSLFESIKNDDFETTKDCTKELSSINFQNEFGHTPLTSAASHGNLKIVKLLVRRHADINMASDERGKNRTPLHFAIKNLHKDVAIFLMCKNAIKNVKDSENKKPLDYDLSDDYTNIKCE